MGEKISFSFFFAKITRNKGLKDEIKIKTKCFCSGFFPWSLAIKAF